MSADTGILPLALGTAQLGMAYGVANQIGKPDDASAERIVRASWAGGVRLFDTAQAYGDRETVLGRALRPLDLSQSALVFSKLHPQISKESPELVRRAFEQSLARLGMPSLHGVMLHDESDLDLWDGRLGLELKKMREEGFCRMLGVSVYSPKAALHALQLPGIDVIQVPANVFDRRMDRSGVFQIAEQQGKAVFIRSVFLQGLALLEEVSIPAHLAFARPAVRALVQFCESHNLNRRQFLIHYLRSRHQAAKLVIGAETAEQASQNCTAVGDVPVAEEVCRQWDQCWPEDQYPLLHPPSWPERR
jgi:aryl-alcohol dehydrogenase-like predicted oxidoreductase